MSKYLLSFDQMPTRAIILANIGLAVFFGVLPRVMAQLIETPDHLLDDFRWVLDGLLVGALIALPTGALAAFESRAQRPAFLMHAFGIIVLVTTLLVWAASILRYGIPAGVGFSWSPGLLTGMAGWAAFVAGRAIPKSPETCRRSRAYLVLAVFVAALPIDIGAMIRAFYDFFQNARHGGA